MGVAGDLYIENGKTVAEAVLLRQPSFGLTPSGLYVRIPNTAGSVL